jgi:hypothetical protein
MNVIISAGHTLPAEFRPEPAEGSYKSHRVIIATPWPPGPITPHNLPDNLSSLSLTHEGLAGIKNCTDIYFCKLGLKMLGRQQWQLLHVEKDDQVIRLGSITITITKLGRPKRKSSEKHCCSKN